MPGLVKIGRTNIDPHDRAKQLHTTGVPSPFKVYGYVKVNNPRKVEKAIHSKLSKYRKATSREFFRYKPSDALKVLESVSGEVEYIRKQEAIVERRRAVEAEKIRQQTEIEDKVFSILDNGMEKWDDAYDFSRFKKWRNTFSLISLLIITVIVIFFKYIEEDTIALFVVLWMFFGTLFLIFNWITKKKYKEFEKFISGIIEDKIAERWPAPSPLKEKCYKRFHEKYNLI